jgi:hypothetical protein
MSHSTDKFEKPPSSARPDTDADAGKDGASKSRGVDDANDWMAERIAPATAPPTTHGRPTGVIETDRGLDSGDAEESRRGQQ